MIDDNGQYVDVVDTPTTEIMRVKGKSREYSPLLMAYILGPEWEKYDTTHHVFIEEQQAMPGQGVRSMFTIGLGFGLWLGILGALKIPYTRVRPAIWKKALGISKDKEMSRIRAQQIFPDAPLSLRKHDGRAEALLLAWYGLREHRGDRS